MGKRRILILDDMAMNRSFIKVFFISKGYETTTAEDGLLGLETFQKETFDLVFSDIEMPNLTGLEFLKAAKKVPGKGHIPIVMLSSLSDEATKTRALSLGAAAYIVKPFTEEKIQDALRPLGLL